MRGDHIVRTRLSNQKPPPPQPWHGKGMNLAREGWRGIPPEGPSFAQFKLLRTHRPPNVVSRRRRWHHRARRVQAAKAWRIKMPQRPGKEILRFFVGGGQAFHFPNVGAVLSPRSRLHPTGGGSSAWPSTPYTNWIWESTSLCFSPNSETTGP